ncbi:hypothetical protein N7447_001845 [Penicillium robsamsonii]|uniref:uncharacterized protein n=1 Tax=Penicillium robsamsonii TaxID=1792511 RepID=UPI002548D1C5|nr:uncharacterized protein N7447_004386 [Penicillium robsamsonii]XP_057090137.1 uncharacterized protein N7447_001845 [Penicillium robsamsonii]KAJ5827623.1 hypothetical protein N7447_004386 [Penicillium robsamsonii]KAJ5835819.1 hypothetical protein N7447_001845 [Penicillium robsamsonii]
METASILSATKGEKLKDETQWRTWFTRVRSYARQKGVWELCDPEAVMAEIAAVSTAIEKPPIRPDLLTEPTVPEYPEEGDAEEKKTWRDRMDLFKIKYARWQSEAKGLADVNEYILIYLDPVHHLAIIPLETPYERLVYLKSRFAQTVTYREEIRMKWRYFSTQRPTGDIEQWIQKWDSMRELTISLGIDDSNPNRDFVYAVKDVLPMWWQAQYQDIVADGKPVDTRVLIESFRAMNNDIGVKTVSSTNAPKSAFSTWQGYQEAKPDTPYEKRRCPCGDRHPQHSVRTCWTVNEAIRPEGKPIDQRKVDRANEQLSKDPGWKKWVDKTIAGAKPKADRPEPKVESANVLTSFITMTKHALSASEVSLRDRWILDSGSSAHVCNNKDLFINLRPDAIELKTGDGSTRVLGRGTVRLIGKHPQRGRMEITLSDALYSPTFHTNLVSYAQLKKKGGTWCQETNCIRDPNKNPVVSVRLWDQFDLWIFDQPDEALPPQQAFAATPQRAASTPRKSVKTQESKASVELWHRSDVGIEIGTDRRRSTTVRDVLYREGTETDLSTAYRTHVWTIRKDSFRSDTATASMKPECQLAINQFVELAKNQWNLPIKAFHYDNELSAGKKAEYSLTSDGILIYHTPPAHAEMNGYAERSGGMIIVRMRMLALEGKLPKELWPYFAGAAVWMLNRTPTYIASENRWIIPWEEVRKEFLKGAIPPRINLAKVRLYGSLAYCRIEHQVKSDKMNPRAEVGFLVGYVASNIYQIWFPHSGKVRHIRDAIIDESRKYTPDYEKFQPIPMPLAKEPEEISLAEITELVNRELASREPVGILERTREEDDQEDREQQAPPPPEAPRDEDENEDNETFRPEDKENEAIRTTLSQEVRDTTPPQGVSTQASMPTPIGPPRMAIGEIQERSEPQKAVPGAFPAEDLPPLPNTPPHEPESDADPGQGVDIGDQDDHLIEDQAQQEEDRTNESEEDDLERQLQSELLAPSREINSSVDVSNILTGSRTRRARRDDDYAYATTIKIAPEGEEPPAFLHAFAAGLYAEKPDTRRHRDDLPPPPKHWKEVLNHPFQQGFLAAAAKEIRSLAEKETFEVIEKPRDRGVQILPLMWVFTYKFDADGYLVKFKARICVRGDLETITYQEKRAATLAARTARMIFALVAAFDLNLRQRDAVTAFLNSKLEQETYSHMPEGFQIPGKCWKLRRALYGLRISPRLWQQEASKVLRKLGLKQAPEDPCVFTGDGILVFFYVDDILIASHPDVKKQADQLERDLESHWELTDHGEAAWFLNIRILRDRRQKKLWLCQDSYVTSIANRFNLIDRPPVYTPLPIEELTPYTGAATPQEILLYQKKVGSAGYATTITRPDAVKATARLAQFLTNPGPEHQRAADRVITYLYTTRNLAIEYSAEVEMDSIQFASDASYGDHQDRKSSAGYICQAYGGPVDWKATKQPTVTTSTTEAELLGLSEAGKQVQWWRRLLESLGFIPSHHLTIDCDNERTIGLLTSEDTAFETKLRHVDIHRHWLRQEVREGRIRVRWVATASMVADGLTKLLSRQKHENFLRMLRMVDISYMLV